MNHKIIRKITSLLCAIVIFASVSVFLCGGASAKEVRFSGFGSIDSASAVVTSETVSYTRKEESYIELNKKVPYYYQMSELPNSCGPTAGATVVGYYDKYYEELIPGFVSYYPATGAYKKIDNIYIPNLMQELYTLMRTNVDDVGVSQSDCLNGLKTYVNNQGYSISFNSLKNGNTVDDSLAAAAINDGQPSMLFCSKTDLKIVMTYTNEDEITCISYSGAHIVVAYGLYIIKYYDDEDNNFRTDKYLNVSSGLAEWSNGMILLNSTDWLVDAYSVKIS